MARKYTSEELHEQWRKQAENHGYISRAIDGHAFKTGTHWSQADADVLDDRNEVPAVTNVLGATLELKVALMSGNTPSWVVHPVEDFDQRMAKVWRAILAHVWHANLGNLELKRVLTHYCWRGGVGYLHFHYDPEADYGKGEVVMKAIGDPLSVAVDPNAKDPLLRDAAWVIIKSVVSRQQALLAYPQHRRAIMNAEAAKPDYAGRGPVRRSYDGDRSRVPLVGDVSNIDDDYVAIYDHYELRTARYTRVQQKDTQQQKVFRRQDYQKWLDGRGYLLDDGVEVQPAILGGVRAEAEKTYEHAREQLDVPDGEAVMMHLVQTDAGVEIALGPESADAIPNSTMILAPERIGTIQKAAKGGVFVTRRYRTQEVVRTLSVGRTTLSRTVLPYDRYPVVPFYNSHDGTPFPQDDVDRAKNIQEQINFLDQKVARASSSLTGDKIIPPEGFFSDVDDAKDKIARMGRDVIPGNYAQLQGRELIRIPPSTIPNDLFAHSDRKIAHLHMVTGIYPEMGGGRGPNREPHRSLVARDQFGQRRILGNLEDVNNALSWAGGLVLQMVQQHYSNKKVVRLVNPNTGGVEEEYEINGAHYDDYGREIERFNDVTVGRYDVRVKAGSTFLSDRAAEAELYVYYYQLGLIDNEEAWKKLEIADIEGLRERMSREAQLMSALQASEAERKELRGDRQTDRRQIENLQSQRKAEKFDTKMDKLLNEATRDREIAKARVDLEAERAKMRMGA